MEVHDFNIKRHDVIIVGAGLSALVTAARLYELGKRDIVIYAASYGGTPYIAAINFVLPDNKFGDTPKQYAEDMIKAGYKIADKSLVEKMCNATVEGYELLKRWHIEFAKEEDGRLKRRHASGSTFPRSLCSTTDLIGAEIVEKLRKHLLEKGVQMNIGYECLKVLVKDQEAYGITVKNDKDEIHNVYADAVVAAWGGVGNLFSISTYPRDIKGNTIAIAYETGAKLVDMEFLEYEPMVVISPEGAVGEPCPTAMLGEGAHLLNSEMERFMLKVRPQGEAGSPKTLVNKEIWKQVSKGKGSKNGGAYVDLRHISIDILKAYPWFYNRMIENGVDPSKELVEVGPMAHSYSGGILVNENYESTVKGLYAVGEACGGIHGACRLAGNAAAQGALSGLLCAEGIMNVERKATPISFEVEYTVDQDIYKKNVPEIRRSALKALGVYRNETDLKDAFNYLKKLTSHQDLKKDTETYQIALSVLVMVFAALERKESRGTHMRTDYPSTISEFERKLIIKKE